LNTILGGRLMASRIMRPAGRSSAAAPPACGRPVDNNRSRSRCRERSPVPNHRTV